MLFQNENQSAELTLHHFEFKTSFEDPDDDWMEIELNLVANNNSFHIIQPALTAAEVYEVADWFRNISCSKQVKKNLYFWEPNLSFHLLNADQKQTTIKICFDAELRPFWAKSIELYSLDCSLSKEQMKSLSSQLHRDLRKLYLDAYHEYGRKKN